MKCRLVLHIWPDGNRHIDLFIQIPGRDSLLTYELPADEILEKPGLLNFQILPERPAGKSWEAFRKSDHRSLYWTQEGPISENRGTILTLGYGEIEGNAGPDKIYLSIQ